MTMSAIALMTVASALFEIGIAHKVGWFRRLNGNVVVNFLSSMAISWMMGAAYGASNMIMAISAVTSTLVTYPYYQAMNAIERGTPEQKARWSGYVEDIKMTFKMLGFIAFIIFKILSAPAWVPRWVRAKKAEVQVRLNNLRMNIPIALKGASK